MTSKLKPLVFFLPPLLLAYLVSSYLTVLQNDPFYVRPEPFGPSDIATLSTNRSVVITGANAGLGYGSAKLLFDAGTAKVVVMACRNIERCEAARESIMAGSEEEESERRPALVAMRLDLESLVSVRRFAEDVQHVLRRYDGDYRSYSRAVDRSLGKITTNKRKKGRWFKKLLGRSDEEVVERKKKNIESRSWFRKLMIRRDKEEKIKRKEERKKRKEEKKRQKKGDAAQDKIQMKDDKIQKKKDRDQQKKEKKRQKLEKKRLKKEEKQRKRGILVPKTTPSSQPSYESHRTLPRPAAAGLSPNLDVLINNVGVANLPYRIAEDTHVEAHLHVNHIAHFALTSYLLDNLSSEGGERSVGRVVSVSSLALGGGRKLTRPNLDRFFTPAAAGGLDGLLRTYLPAIHQFVLMYGASKRANLLFARGIDTRIPVDVGIEAVGAHPGYNRVGSMSDEEGALCQLRAALDRENVGKASYVGPLGFSAGRCVVVGEVMGSWHHWGGGWGMVDEEVDALWEFSEEVIGDTFR